MVLSAMFQAATLLLGGFMASDLKPCSLAPGWKGPTSKLRLYIQGVRPFQDDARPAPGRRLFVTVSCAGTEKKTEFGDWSDEEHMWCFEEVLTLEVDADDEVCIVWSCSEGYNLVVTQLATPPRLVGEIIIPMVQLVPQIAKAEHSIDGFVYAKQDVSIDLRKDGGKTGTLVFSFEARRPPLKGGGCSAPPMPWCTSCKVPPGTEEISVDVIDKIDHLSGDIDAPLVVARTLNMEMDDDEVPTGFGDFNEGHGSESMAAAQAAALLLTTLHGTSSPTAAANASMKTGAAQEDGAEEGEEDEEVEAEAGEEVEVEEGEAVIGEAAEDVQACHEEESQAEHPPKKQDEEILSELDLR